MNIVADIPATEALLAFRAALMEVKDVMRTKEADTGRYTYHYADIGDVIDEIKRVLYEQGLVPTQIPTAAELAGTAMLAVHLHMIHTTGQVLEFEPLMMVLPREAQAYGSALTYAKRYQLLSVFEIAPEDDDGKAATIAEQTQPGRRTEAERMIRESIAGMDEAKRARFQAAFREEFHSSLTDLPAARHGDALTWARKWEQDDVAEQDNADAQWVADAQGAEEHADGEVNIEGQQ